MSTGDMIADRMTPEIRKQCLRDRDERAPVVCCRWKSTLKGHTEALADFSSCWADSRQTFAVPGKVRMPPTCCNAQGTAVSVSAACAYSQQRCWAKAQSKGAGERGQEISYSRALGESLFIRVREQEGCVCADSTGGLY